jgi:hypothetical protein
MQENTFGEPLEGVGPENLDFLGPNGTRFTHCHFRTPKKSRFSGPTLSSGPRNCIFLHQNHYVPRHITTGTLTVINYHIILISKGKTHVVEETSHVKQLSLKHVCKIGLKDVDVHVMQKAVLSAHESKFFLVKKE